MQALKGRRMKKQITPKLLNLKRPRPPEIGLKNPIHQNQIANNPQICRHAIKQFRQHRLAPKTQNHHENNIINQQLRALIINFTQAAKRLLTPKKRPIAKIIFRNSKINRRVLMQKPPKPKENYRQNNRKITRHYTLKAQIDAISNNC